MIGAKTELDLEPLEGLNKSGIRRATRIGLNRAASPVKASVVSHAEAIRKYGYLAKSIRIRLKIYPADRFVAVIGPGSKFARTKGKYVRGKRAGQKRLIKPSKYAHLVEEGTRHAHPQPWLEPAHNATAGRFLQEAGRQVGAELERELFRTFKTKRK